MSWTQLNTTTTMSHSYWETKCHGNQTHRNFIWHFFFFKWTVLIFFYKYLTGVGFQSIHCGTDIAQRVKNRLGTRLIFLLVGQSILSRKVTPIVKSKRNTRAIPCSSNTIAALAVCPDQCWTRLNITTTMSHSYWETKCHGNQTQPLWDWYC